MRETSEQSHKDFDNVLPKKESFDLDIDGEIIASNREKVLEEISEYNLNCIQAFMFGGPNKLYGDATDFVVPALKQIERFIYVWMNDLSEESRRSIINYWMGYDKDCRSRKYTDYLKSPAWRYVSGIIKMVKDYTCEECGKRTNPVCLVVHHKTYAHLGSELDHIDDLAVLCASCHMKIHGIGGQNERR